MDYQDIYFKHDGLSQEQIRALKHEIDSIENMPNKYYVTNTWVEYPSWAFDMHPHEVELQRERQIIDYCFNLMHHTKAHVKVWTAISRPHLNMHWHGVLVSDKPIAASIAFRSWKEGQQKHFVKYDPLYGEKYHNDPDRNCIPYIFGKWDEHRQLSFGDVYCPRKRKSCRRGNCKYRTEQYKMKVKEPML